MRKKDENRDEIRERKRERESKEKRKKEKRKREKIPSRVFSDASLSHFPTQISLISPFFSLI
jgi:hypothetical protein